MTEHSLLAHARSLVEANAYLTLGTVSPEGRPWTTPVYFASDDVEQFYWVSAQDSRHSQNIAANPVVSLVVFDSTVPPYHGRALYTEGDAHLVDGDELSLALRVYPGPPQRGGGPVDLADVTGSSPWRMYRAQTSQVWVLCPREPRQPCPLHGRTDDHRARVLPQ